MIVRGTLTATAALALLAAGVAPARAVSSTPLSCAQPNSEVRAIAISGTVAYLGGEFTIVKDKGGGLHARAHLAAVDTRTCDLLPWVADTNGNVNAITVSAGVVFAGGEFTAVKGLSRGRLAGITTAGAVTGFNPGLDGAVTGLTVLNGGLYAGGDFKTASGIRRLRLAAWSVGTGNIGINFAPEVTGQVFTVASEGSRIYVGGGFTKLNGLGSSRNLAAVNALGAIDNGFRPAASFPVEQVVATGGNVYAAGGGGGGRVALWNSSGALRQPLSVTDGDVQTIAVSGDSVYGGGHFANFCKGGKATGTPPTCIDPLSRRKVLEISISGAAVTGWAPVLNSAHGVTSSAVDPATGRLWLGGDFTKVNQKPAEHLAVFG